MSTNTLSRVRETLPAMFNDFFKPWNEWFDGDFAVRTLTVPAVNITEKKDKYKVELAVPGMKKEDFSVDISGSMLTISAAKENENEETDKKYTRKEYSYSSFSRSFTLPAEVNKSKIEATYKDGLLTLVLPKTESAIKDDTQRIKIN